MRSTKGAGRKQPHRLPPPITHAPEALEGLAVLEESPGALGLLLWKSLRAVEMWAALEPARRRGAFVSGAYGARIEQVRSPSTPVALVEPLVLLAGVLRGAAEAELVAAASRQVADWAREAGRGATALAFVQAAALVLPRDAELALRTAEQAAAVGQGARAETWYRQALSNGRRFGDWRSYELAHLQLSRLHAERGNAAASRRSVLRALRSATRRAHRDVQGMARHALAERAVAAGRNREVMVQAREALDAYGPRHAALPELARLLARAWAARGFTAPAAALLRGAGDDDAEQEARRLARAAKVSPDRRPPPSVATLARDVARALAD